MTFLMKGDRERILSLVLNASKFKALVLRERFFGDFEGNLEIEASLKELRTVKL